MGPMAGTASDDGGPEVTLRNGEKAIDEAAAGEARFVLTDRRLLVLRAAGTPRRRSVDRDNLGSVGVRSESDRGYLVSAAVWAAVGGFLLAVRQFAPLGVLARPVERPPDVGFEGLFAAADALTDLLGLLPAAFLIGGVLAILWAGVRVGMYVRSRDRFLEIAVVGADPVRLPVPEESELERVRELLERARPGSASGSG